MNAQRLNRACTAAIALMSLLALASATGCGTSDSAPTPLSAQHGPLSGVDRVNIGSDSGAANGTSDESAISADGRCVAFSSSASNLVADDTNETLDVFVHDRQTGATERVSVDSLGNQADAESEGADISGDGRYVTFFSYASNLVPGHSSYEWAVYLHDRETGETRQVSVNSKGEFANAPASDPSISSDGRYVAFGSAATNLVPEDIGIGQTAAADDESVINEQLFVYDRDTGAIERVSASSEGQRANDGSGDAKISADGRYVAFRSWATNLVSGDTNGVADVFVRDRQLGETTRVSVGSSGQEGNGPSGAYGLSLSGDARYVAFQSFASNLVEGDGNNYCEGDKPEAKDENCPDIFVHDRLGGTTERVSVSSAGGEADGASEHVSISADGRWIVFQSDASNLVAGDTNGFSDIFLHDRDTKTTTRISTNAGSQVNGWSMWPDISADGMHVAFGSFRANYFPGDLFRALDVFVYDR